MTTPIAKIDAYGISVPQFSDVLDYFRTSFQSIYGADIYIEEDSQDGQALALWANAIHDANSTAVSVYNAFSPSTARGNGLSSVVKVNGISRQVSSYSTVDLLIVGQFGSIITNGIVSDVNSVQWALPPTVTIPAEGQITVTATCKTLGAVTAPAGTVTAITTPTYGWQSVTNLAAAAVGAPVETDAQLRIRQTNSTSLPAQTGLDSLVGAVSAVDGVTACKGYENDGDRDDVNGLPPKSLALVVTGGDAAAIAQVILVKKPVGSTCIGTTVETVFDSNGIPRNIRFYRPATVQISFSITLRATTGYTDAVGLALKSALATWVNGLGDGVDISYSRAFTPANSVGTSYEITSLLIGSDGGALAASDISIPFNAKPTCSVDDISITVGI